MGVLDEGAGVAVEVDGLLGVEEHGLLGVHLNDEILQGAKADYMVQAGLFFVGKVCELAAFL